MKQCALVILLSVSAATDAAERWAILGSARGPEVGCNAIYRWQTPLILHNLGSEATVARVLGFSNGVGAEVPLDVHVAGSESRVIPDPTDIPRDVVVFVIKMDIPSTAELESRLEYRYEFPCSTVPPLPGPNGQVPLPVYRELAVPHKAQLHLGTDLGMQAARLNVGVYNAGTIPATAVVETRRAACPAEGVVTTIGIAPDTLEQFPVQLPPVCGDVTNVAVPQHVSYVIVTVDQPSLSYAIPLSKIAPPSVTFGVSAPR